MKRFLLLLTSAIASSMLAALPSQAATFASSQGLFNFTNFSQSPFSVVTDTNTKTLAIAKSGMVNALANAQAALFLSVIVISATLKRKQKVTLNTRKKAVEVSRGFAS